MNVKKLAETKGFTIGQLNQFGVRDGQGGVVIPYRDASGNEYIRSRVMRDPTEENKDGRWWSKGEASIIPYGLERPVPCNRGLLWIVEGESDCWTLWLNEIPALGVPGAKMQSCLQAAHVEGVKEVAVVQEPGEAGEQFPHRIANRLYDLGFKGRVFAVRLSEKDPRALWLKDRDGFVAALRKDYQTTRTAIEAPKPVAAGTRSVSFADVFDLPIEDVDWLVDGLIPKGGVTLLSAKPKVGKSVFARNLALAVVRGGRFLGRRCAGGAVLWLAIEERQEQVITAFKTMGFDRNDPVRFHFGSAPADAIAWLKRECEAFKPTLVVIDTWHKLTMIENINDYAAVNRANEPLMRLSRELGVAQVWVHHNNKSVAGNGDEVLGSSALFAAADVLLTMTRSNEGVRAVRSIQRMGTDLEDTVVEMDDSGLIHGAGSRYTAQVEALKPMVAKAVEAGPLTRPEIVKSIEGRSQLILAALNELLSEGFVIRAEGTGKRGDPIRYQSHQNPYSNAPKASSQDSLIYPGTTGIAEPPSRERPGTTGNLSEPPEPPELETTDDALWEHATSTLGASDSFDQLAAEFGGL